MESTGKLMEAKEIKALVEQAKQALFFRTTPLLPLPALPYLAPLVSHLNIVVSNRFLVAAAHRGGTIEFGAAFPQFLEELQAKRNLDPLQGAALVLLHEVGHYLLEGWERGELWEALHPEEADRLGRKTVLELWNVAQDAVINQSLVARYGFPLAPDLGLVLPDSFDPPLPPGLTAEEYMDLLVSRAQASPQDGSGQDQEEPRDGEEEPGDGEGEEGDEGQEGAGSGEEGQESSGEEGSGGWEAGEPEEPEEEPEEAEEPESQVGSGGETRGGQGNGPGRGRPSWDGEEGSEPGNGEGQEPGPSLAGDMADDPPSPEEILEGELANPLGENGERLPHLRKAVEEALKAAVAKGIGTSPGHLQALIEREFAEKPLPWKALLRMLVKRAMGRVRQTPSGRKRAYPHPHQGVRDWIRMAFGGGRSTVLKPRRLLRQPRVGVVLDTSGSMWSGAAQKRILGEVQEILEEVGEVVAYQVDTTLQRRETLRRLDQEYQVVGGGGTDMAPGILAAERDGVDLCVVFTDAWTHGFHNLPSPPRMPVLAVILREKGERAPSLPPWVRVVEVEMEI